MQKLWCFLGLAYTLAPVTLFCLSAILMYIAGLVVLVFNFSFNDQIIQLIFHYAYKLIEFGIIITFSFVFNPAIGHDHND